MLGHYTHEEKNKFFIFSVVGILATLALVAILFAGFGSTENAEQNNPPDETKISEQKKVAAVSAQYLVALNNLLAEINNSPAESTVAIAEASLFSMRVPKEMLDKHLPAVLAVAKLKGVDVVSANEQVKKIVGDLLVEARKISN